MRHRKPIETLSLTEANLAKLGHPPETQIDVWKKTQETHEQLAVGQGTSRDFKDTQEFVNDMEKRVLGMRR